VPRKRLREISAQRPRWGWRKAHAVLRREGQVVNRKRTRRLWIAEGLKRPARARKRRRVGPAAGQRMRAERPNQVWAIDFQTDVTACGRQLRFVNVVDEFTREALATRVARLFTADATVAVLDELVIGLGRRPEHPRMDNGPVLTAHALPDWCRLGATATAYIDPGSPWQHGYVESFNGRFRDEFLTTEAFATLLEAQILAEDWRTDYNTHRPHGALNDLTPEAFRNQWADHHQPALGAKRSGTRVGKRVQELAAPLTVCSRETPARDSSRALVALS
jgi:putative transposase